MHEVPPCHAERKEVRRPPRILDERAAKTAYDSAELEGRSGGIGLRGARCVTVMFLGWHVISYRLYVLNTCIFCTYYRKWYRENAGITEETDNSIFSQKILSTPSPQVAWVCRQMESDSIHRGLHSDSDDGAGDWDRTSDLRFTNYLLAFAFT